MYAHIVGEQFVCASAHLIAGLERGNLLAETFDNAGELEHRAVAPEAAHVNQNHVILWLNHGPNLPAAPGRRLAQKVQF